MIAHHFIFIFCSLVCGKLRVLGFAFSWLIIGELSTGMHPHTHTRAVLKQLLGLPDVDPLCGCCAVLLGIRWFLIKSGRGASSWMRWTNGAFALTFFATRLGVYGAGARSVPSIPAEHSLSVVTLSASSAAWAARHMWVCACVCVCVCVCESYEMGES
jgi:hypothetical protein